MSDIIVAFAVVTVLSGGPPAGATAREAARPISTAVAEASFAAAPTERVLARFAGASSSRDSLSRDSLKNGALFGAVVGAVLGGVVGAVGCGLSSMFSEEPHCGGPTFVGAAGGAGLGVLIGMGIDALVDHAPRPVLGGVGRRTVVRLQVKF